MKEYEVEINGVKHTMQLTAEDAERFGESARLVKQAAPANKSRTTQNK